MENSSMFHSAYNEVSLNDELNSNSESDIGEMPFIDEERVPLRQTNTPPIIRVEESLSNSRFMQFGNNIRDSMRNSRGILPDLEIGESRESFYWRWIAFGVPAFYGILLAFVSTIRTLAGHHDYMTKFAFWWSFTFELGIVLFRLYTRL